MSFSGEVKEELAKQVSTARHCQIAELAAIIYFCGRLEQKNGKISGLRILTENASVARKYFTLLKKTFNIETMVTERKTGNTEQGGTFDISIDDLSHVLKICHAIKLLDGSGIPGDVRSPLNLLVIKNTCCKRAFLRGAFLSIGSMSDPEKSYHLEMVCTNEEQAVQLKELLIGFELDAKIVQRKKYFVVYLKEGANLVDFLNIIEAHISLMNLENMRILKEMRNSINRRVNCEAANISKTVTASSKQIEDIELLRDSCGFESLPDTLKEMAEIRLQYPDATLKELGQYLDPIVGKSGVNHRLRKLSEVADHIRT